MKYIRVLTVLLMLLMLSGCSATKLTLNPQELYALPQLPERYTALNEQISTILEGGAEYAAPATGSSIQPVQMVDLDGDGREEALAFFRKADDEKPLKISIFTAEGVGYRQTALIEGSGTAFNSIAYSDLNADGRMEMIVSWRVSAELQALSVYALRGQEAESLIHTNYVKYTVADLNGDGKRELIALRADQVPYAQQLRRVPELKLRRGGRDHDGQVARGAVKPRAEPGARSLAPPECVGLRFQAEAPAHLAEEHALELREAAAPCRQADRRQRHARQAEDHSGMAAQGKAHEIHRGIAVVDRAVKVVYVDAHVLSPFVWVCP